MKVGFVLLALVIISMLLWKAGFVPESLWQPKTEEAQATGVPPAAQMKAPVLELSSLGSTGTGAITFKSLQTSANSLLTAQLSTGGEAGQITRMNLTAQTTLDPGTSTLRFGVGMGDDMHKAIHEAVKFSQLRHKGWPVGHSLEIGLQDKYVGQDGPSAAVACALLLEGAITGKKWDPAFAVTGDMNADGSVLPTGGLAAKIRGVTRGPCKMVGVPMKNEKAVADLLVTDGPAVLVAVNIFSLAKFDDVLVLADLERPAALQTALANFDSMRTVMLRTPQQLVPLLRNPHAAQRLQALYTAAPNCLSAKYLLMYLQGNAPRTLSLSGSMEASQASAQAILTAINHDIDGISTLTGDELGGGLNKLRRLRPLLDPRVHPYVDSLIAYAEIVRLFISNPPTRGSARYSDMMTRGRNAAGGAKAAYQKLINEPQVREELGL